MNSLEKGSLIFIAMLFVVHLSCGDSPTSSVPTSGTMKVSVKSIGSGTPTSSSKTIGKPAAFVTITSARIVIEKIELKSSVGDMLDFELEQPFIQDLVVGSNIHEIETIEVPFGTYEEMAIKIDELDEEDNELYAQNPELQNRSIVVKGHLNNAPSQNFVFTSDLSGEPLY